MTRPARRRSEDGAVAIVVAVLVASLMLALAAVGVDTARWYVERERLQKAADAAALAGVVFMPNDLPNAVLAAQRSAARNGYVDGEDVDVVVVEGAEPTQLRVTITSTIDNQFGTAIGVPQADLERTAVADFTGPAPMGSPCNTFGNQPPSQTHALPTGFAAAPVSPAVCAQFPNFWAAVEGPATDKVQGDRFSTLNCPTTGNAGTATFGCKSKVNEEYRPDGYFFAIKVQASAVNKPMQVQIYDPAYVHTSINCSALPTSANIASNDLNDYAKTDAKNRYATTVDNPTARQYCSGDYNPGASGAATTPPTTSFAVRQQTDTNDPTKAPVEPGCTKQYAPIRSFGINNLTRGNSSYVSEFARIFHQWVPLCTFTPRREGDYYLQVRTNVSTGGSATTSGGSNFAMEYRDNAAVTVRGAGNTTSGQGLNSFSVRAVVPNSTTALTGVSVSGYARMPILQNVAGSTATFNLIRAIPATRGQSINFDFFDPADGAGANSASVRVIRPSDATGSIRNTANISGCKGRKNKTGAFETLNPNNCTATVTGNSYDGQLQEMSIPIPNDYNCESTKPGGCWFTVEVKFPAGVNVTDFTTWTANVGGDPVRLIE